jgi:arylsulfatase A-like enzyme
LISPELAIPWNELREVRIRARSSQPVRARLFWAESKQEFLEFWNGKGSISFRERLHLFRSAEIPMTPANEFRTFRVSFRGLEPPGWRLTRIDAPILRHLILQFPGTAAGEIEIEEVALVTYSETFDGSDFGPAAELIGGVVRDSIFLRAPGRLRLPADLRPGARVEIAVSVPGGSAPIDLKIEAPPGTTRMHRTIPAGPEWHPVSWTVGTDLDGVREIAFTLSGNEATITYLGSPIVVHPRNRDRPRRVILYVVDALSARHLGAYGYPLPTSPTLDALAAEGVVFFDCVAQSAWTRPSTVSILTGLYPPAHGVVSWSDRLPTDVPTLAGMFRRAGYHTVSYITNPHAGVSAGLDRGFDVVHETPAITGPLLESLDDSAETALLSSGTSHAINDRFFPWLREHVDTPAFIYLHSMDPHFPYRPPPPFERGVGPPATTGNGQITPDHLYDGDIAFNDREIGRILDLMQLLGIRDDTLILVTADHGEEFGEHGHTGHRNHLHGEITHVPWILVDPGRIPPGLRIDQRVETIDILPTLADHLGLPPPALVQGRSLMPLVRGQALPPRPAWSHLVRRIVAEDRTRLRLDNPPGEFAFLDGPWLFLSGGYEPQEPRWSRLYRLDEDPGESRDVAGLHSDRVERYHDRVRAWYGEQIRLRENWGAADTGVHHDEEAERRLRALGYLQ